MYDDNGKFLSKEEVLELAKTDAGKKLVKTYLLRARLVFTAQSLFEALDIVPDNKMQILVCEVLERCIVSTPTTVILDYVDSIKQYYDENSVDDKFVSPDFIGNC